MNYSYVRKLTVIPQNQRMPLKLIVKQGRLSLKQDDVKNQTNQARFALWEL